MKPKRSNFEPPEVRLSFLMMGFWSCALSTWLMFLFAIVVFAPPGESCVRLKLLPKASHTLWAARGQRAEIVIQEDWLITFDGIACDVAGTQKLPELQHRIRDHAKRSNTASIIVYVEGGVPFQRIFDVLNAFEACGHPRYRIVIVPPFVGPRIPIAKPLEPSPEWLLRMVRSRL